MTSARMHRHGPPLVGIGAFLLLGTILAGCLLIEPFSELARDRESCSDCDEPRDAAAPLCHADVMSDPDNCGACGTICVWDQANRSTCNAGKCTLACTPSFDDCDRDASNGCEVDLTSDPKNCARCGHSCEGSCALICKPLVLTENQDSPTEVVVGPEYVYWDTRGGAGKIPIHGGESTGVSSTSSPERATSLALSSSHLHWYDPAARTIYKATLPSGAYKTVISNQTVAGIAVDDLDVVWSESATGEIRALDGISYRTIVSRPADGVGKLAIDATTVYFIAPLTRKLFKVSRAGGQDPIQLFQAPLGTTLDALALDASRVYFATHHSGGGAIHSVEKNGSGLGLLFGAAFTPSIATDGTEIFYTDPVNGWVLKQSVAGGSGSTAIASEQPTPWGIAIDGKSVYWTNRGTGPDTGSLRKIEKAP